VIFDILRRKKSNFITRS